MSSPGELLAAVPQLAWTALVVSIGIPAIFAVLPHVRFRYHHWRLRRRLQVQPVILGEELREYEQAAGDEPAPIEWWTLIGNGLRSGGLIACIFWLEENGFDRWVASAFLLLFVLSVARMVWHRVNDPPELALSNEEPGYRPSYSVPTEAWQGFGLAALVLITLLSLVLAVRG